MWLHGNLKKTKTKRSFADIQRRIELIQDFEMPTVATSIKVSKDGQFVLAAGKWSPRRFFVLHSKMWRPKAQLVTEQKGSRFTVYSLFLQGTYKPRIRCYDTYQLSLKFERCLDSDGKSADCMAPTLPAAEHEK